MPARALKLVILVCHMVIGNWVIGQKTPKIRINPGQAYGGTMQEYFDSIEYIPLETTQESLFGDISQLLVTDTGFVINDSDTKTILFFRLRESL